VIGAKTFDPFKANEIPPENCGYAIRTIKINTLEEVLEVRNPKNKHIEHKIGLNQLKGLLMNNISKQIIKNKKNTTSKPNQEIGKLIQGDYIQFMLLIADGKIDMIAPSYLMYKTFNDALMEIEKNKKNMYGILKLAENYI
jgi:hypothetical protein